MKRISRVRLPPRRGAKIARVGQHQPARSLNPYPHEVPALQFDRGREVGARFSDQLARLPGYTRVNEATGASSPTA